MPIIYSLVSRNTQVLAEFTSIGLTGNFSTVTRVLLKKINPNDGDTKLSYICGEYIFHYIVYDGLTYLCMTDMDFTRLLAFKYLEDIKTRFLHTYGHRAKTAIAFAFNAEFQRVLSSLMDKYNLENDNDPSKQKIKQVTDQINQVKDVMIKNIDRVLERDERIELLVDRTEELDQHAFKFKSGSSRLKRTLWWKNIKMIIIMVAVFLLVLYIILAMACGADLSSC